jgi:hypothetical protein
MTFNLGNSRIQVTDFDIDSVINHVPLEEPQIAIDKLPETPLSMPALGNIVGGPKLHNWAKTNSEKIDGTVDVMKKAYQAFYEESLDLPRDDIISHVGFASELQPNGGIVLQVMGNCACLGPDPTRFKFADTMENGFTEYDLHNTDTQAQRASIIAGLGHIAFMAGGKEPVAQTLF